MPFRQLLRALRGRTLRVSPDQVTAVEELHLQLIPKQGSPLGVHSGPRGEVRSPGLEKLK